MPAGSRANTGSLNATTIAVVAASMLVHGIALFVVDIRQPAEVDKRNAKARKAKAATAVATDDGMIYSCVADAHLATSAQLGFCATPFAGGPEACVRRAWTAHSKAVGACKPPPEADAVALALIDEKSLARIKPMAIMPLLEPERQKRFEKKQEKKIEQKHLAAVKRQANPRAAGQVVEITRPRLEMTPEKARYLSQYDSTVKKQMVARGSTEKMTRAPAPEHIPIAKDPKPLPKNLMHRPAGETKTEVKAQPPEPPETPSKATKIADKNEAPQPGPLTMRKPGIKEILAKRVPGLRSGVAAPVTPSGLVARRGDGSTRAVSPRKAEAAVGEGGRQGTRREKVPNLFPSKQLLQRTVGGGSVDKLDGVATGESNALNTRRWKFAGFFNRLKRQVARNWHPARAYLRRDPNGNVYGTKDRITVVKVTLTKDGAVDGIIVSRGSGVGFLDDEAIRAFRAAQPFPHPPGALVSKDSQKITFSFGFHFQVGQRRDRWRVFRYR